LLIEFLINQLKLVYYYKFNLSSLTLVLIASYLVYKYFKYEIKITQQAFLELLKMKSFQEILFIEEEYFRNKQIRHKKIAGTINGETYYC